jgi:hypothetical protein
MPANVATNNFLFVRAALATLVLLAATAVQAADYVIHICVDGLNAAMMQELIDAGFAPNFKRFQDEGVWTANARTDFTHTNTLPNHTSMFTGRPVTQPEGMSETIHHGWATNKAPTRGNTLHTEGNPKLKYIASVFDVVHDATI